MIEEPRQVYRWPKVALLFVLVLVLSALLVPSFGWRCHIRAESICAHHLSQLHRLGTSYAAMHHGKWPDAQGEQLWAFFAQSQPPLIEPAMIEVLFCPVKGEEPVDGATDYRGPAGPVATLGPNEPLGADKPGNHGHKFGGNVLRMDGGVMEHDLDDPGWRRCESLLKP